MNMGAEDHGISKLMPLPDGEVVTLAGGWKGAIAYQTQKDLAQMRRCQAMDAGARCQLGFPGTRRGSKFAAG